MPPSTSPQAQPPRKFYDLVYVISCLTTISMILRMISFAYTLRLVPKLGHFMMLTFKMMSTFCSFLVVYCIILIGFGSLFHFLLHDPKCPSLKLKNYDTIQSSCYQTFLMMLGMAQFPADHSSLTRTVYILYLLIVTIILLNLIIAVLSWNFLVLLLRLRLRL